MENINFIKGPLFHVYDIVDRTDLEVNKHNCFMSDNGIYSVYVEEKDLALKNKKAIFDKIKIVCRLSEQRGDPLDLYRRFRQLLIDQDMYNAKFYDKIIYMELDKFPVKERIMENIWKDISKYYMDPDDKYMKDHKYGCYDTINKMDSISYTSLYKKTFFPYYEYYKLYKNDFKYYKSEDNSIHIITLIDTIEGKETRVAYIFITDVYNKTRKLSGWGLNATSNINGFKTIFTGARLEKINPNNFDEGDLLICTDGSSVVVYKNDKEGKVLVTLDESCNGNIFYQFRLFHIMQEIYDAINYKEITEGDYILIQYEDESGKEKDIKCILSKSGLSGITTDDELYLTKWLAKELHHE